MHAPARARRHVFALACSLAALAAALPAAAHGPTRQKVTETISIDATPDAVWSRIKDFDALSKWHPAGGGQPGHQRQQRRLGAQPGVEGRRQAGRIARRL